MEPSTFHSRDDASDRATVEAQLDEWATYSHRQYGAQLRAWVGLQVDEHVSRIVPGLLDARLMPMSETMVELQRQVAVHSSAMDQLQEKLDNELHRTELKLGTARLEAHGELAERTRKSIAALEAQEVEARRDLERRLEDLEAATKALEESSSRAPEQRLLQNLAQRLEDMEERQETPAAGLKKLSSKVEALDEEVAHLVQAQAAQDRARHFEARVKSLEKAKEIQGNDLERMEEQLKKRLQEQNMAVQSSMDKIRQSMLVLVRTELAKAFRSEAKAITAMTS